MVGWTVERSDAFFPFTQRCVPFHTRIVRHGEAVAKTPWLLLFEPTRVHRGQMMTCFHSWKL